MCNTITSHNPFWSSADYIIDSREGYMGNRHPEKTNVDRGEADFEGWEFPMWPSRAVNIYYIIHRLHYAWYQNNLGQVNICVCIKYSVYSNAHTTPVRIYGEPYAHKFCEVDIFWNINRRQAKPPVAKFYHVLGRGFMTQRVILIFIKLLSANQNKLFYMKV